MKRFLNYAFLLLSITFYAQEVLWDKSIGGVNSDYLSDIIVTPDNGYLLGGNTYSDNSGNKTIKSKGDLDYYIVKVDEYGAIEWQKSFGGPNSDYLKKINSTWEGGYILVGNSESAIGGDKKTFNAGLNDFWIIKVNPMGEEEWQTSIGGEGNDMIVDVIETPDKGFIIGGTSNSNSNFNENQLYGKTHDSRGSSDFWVLKISAEGEIEWQKTLGGVYMDELKHIHFADNNTILLSGNSNSPASGDKFSDNFGDSDYWLINLNLDGDILWQKTFGSKLDDELMAVVPTTDNGYLVGGFKQKEDDDTISQDWWIIKINDLGDIIWERTFDIGENDILVSITNINDDEFILSGYDANLSKNSKQSKTEDFVYLKIDADGKKLWKRTLGGKLSDRLIKAVESRDGGIVLAGTSVSDKDKDKESKNRGREDFWIVKLLDDVQSNPELNQYMQIYPNPAEDYLNIIVHKSFKKGSYQIFDMLGRSVQEGSINKKLTPIEIMQLQTGLYSMKVSTDKNIYIAKFLKK